MSNATININNKKEKSWRKEARLAGELEIAVRENNLEKIKKIYDEADGELYSARALGLACLYSDMKLIKYLISKGANFLDTMYSKIYKNEFKTVTSTLRTKYHRDYFYMLAITSKAVVIDGMFINTWAFNFGHRTIIDTNFNTDEFRADVAKYMLEHNVEGIRPESLLYYSLCAGNIPLSEMLISKGIKIDLSCYNYAGSTLLKREMMSLLAVLPPHKCLYALKKFNEQLALENSKLRLANTFFHNQQIAVHIANNKPYEFINSDEVAWADKAVLQYIINETNAAALNKKHLLINALDTENIQAIKIFSELGFISRRSERDFAIDYATKNEKKECLAWLMDYKNRTSDPEKEYEEEMKRMMKRLNEKPDSVVALKRLWRFRELKDGTLKIILYKGDEECVVVPARVGKKRVSVIGSGTIASFWVYRDTHYSGKYTNVRKIIIESGIERIEKYAFEGIETLDEVHLPASVNWKSSLAFSACKKHKTIREK